MTKAISIGWPGFIGDCRSIFLRYSYWSLTGHIGGFREGAEGAAAPLFCTTNTTILLWKSFFVLIPSSEALTLLNFASRIRPRCCMLHVLKSEVFIRSGGEGENQLGPLFLNFLDPPPGSFWHNGKHPMRDVDLPLATNVEDRRA